MIDCENFGDGFLAKLNLWAVEHCVPFSTTFELTPFCNYKCVMCYVRLDKERAENQGKMLEASQWIEIARQLRDMGTLKISLTGGEVFTHPDFWKIYSELNQMGFWISILSNGSLINEETMKKFRKFGMPHAVKLTAYGACDETYSRVCGAADGFSKLSTAIDLLKEAQVPVTMTGTIVKENAEDLLAMYHFAAEKKVFFQHSIAVMKSSRNSINSIEKSRLGFIDYSRELTLDELEKSKYVFSEDPFYMCASYRKSLFVTWNGNFQLCSFLTEPHVKYSGDAQNDFKTLYALLNQVKNPEECSACEWKEFCQRCPAVLCAESGHPQKIDKDFCLTAKQLKMLYDSKKGMEL